MRSPPCSCPGTSRVHRPAASRLDTNLNKFTNFIKIKRFKDIFGSVPEDPEDTRSVLSAVTKRANVPTFVILCKLRLELESSDSLLALIFTNFKGFWGKF
jgi:hypothetical protein